MGYVTSAWALLEEHHAWLIANLLNLQEEIGVALTAEMGELQRLTVITILVTLTGKSKWMDEWADIINDVHRLRPLRNNAIHSVTWGYSAEDLSIRRFAGQHMGARQGQRQSLDKLRTRRNGRAFHVGAVDPRPHALAGKIQHQAHIQGRSEAPHALEPRS